MANRKIILGIVLLIIALLIAIIWITSSKIYPTGSIIKNKDSYKIGVIAPLTGAGANLGPAFVNGEKIAVEEINSKNGINNKKLELFVQDGKLEGKESIDAANYLLNIENPDIFSVIFHLPAKSVSQILKDNKKPLIYEAFTRSIKEENPNSFKSHFDSLTGCEEIAKYFKTYQKDKRLGVLMANVEYGDLCIEGVKNIEPNVKVYRYNFGESDFRTILYKAKSDNVDNLIFIGFDYEYIALFRQLSETDIKIKVICATASECIFPEVIKSSTNETLEGTYGIDVIPMNIRETDFFKEYSKKYGIPSNTELNFAALGYEEVQYISKAMENCNPGESECLIEELKKVKDYKSLIGSSGFKDRVLQLKTNIYQYKNNTWVLLE